MRGTPGDDFLVGLANLGVIIVAALFVGNLLSQISGFVMRYVWRRGKNNYDLYLENLKAKEPLFYDELTSKSNNFFGVKELSPSRLFHLCWITIAERRPAAFNQAMHWWHLAISARSFAFALLLPLFPFTIIRIFESWYSAFILFGALGAFFLLMHVSQRYDEHFTRDVFNAFYSYCAEGGQKQGGSPDAGQRDVGNSR